MARRAFETFPDGITAVKSPCTSGMTLTPRVLSERSIAIFTESCAFVKRLSSYSDESFRPTLLQTPRFFLSSLQMPWPWNADAAGDGTPKFAAVISRNSAGPARRCALESTHGIVSGFEDELAVAGSCGYGRRVIFRV